MPKLHTTTHDIPVLEQRLKALLEAPPQRIAFTPAKLTLTQQMVRRLAASGPLPRKMINGVRAWRMTGYSPRWLAARIPLLRAVVRRGRAFFQFRRQVNAHLNRHDHQFLHQDEKLSRMFRELTVEHATLMQRLARLEGLEPQAAQMREKMQEAVVAGENRLTRLEGIVAKGGVPGEHADSATREYADYYLALENLYRGESDAIEERFEPYMKYIADAGAGGAEDPVLDLGCGRGEWLRVLRRNGLQSKGVDADAAMLSKAREDGSNVVQCDLLQFLETAEPASYGGVTSFQVVEHLPLEALLRMFAGAARVLRAGGVLILETPNPENLQVSGYSFWLDPTHVRPLPPPLLDYFARYFGFVDVQIVRTHPYPASQHLTEDSPGAHHINKLLFCEQDYALIARKPL